MDKTDRLRDYGLAFLLYEQGLGVCGYELIRELFIFVKLILNSYLEDEIYQIDKSAANEFDKQFPPKEVEVGTPSQKRFNLLVVMRRKAI